MKNTSLSAIKALSLALINRAIAIKPLHYSRIDGSGFWEVVVAVDGSLALQGVAKDVLDSNVTLATLPTRELACLAEAADDQIRVWERLLAKRGIEAPAPCHEAYPGSNGEDEIKAWGVRTVPDKGIVYEALFQESTARRLAELCDAMPEDAGWDLHSAVLQAEGFDLREPAGALA